MKKIVITGPESTGKSTLTLGLAKHFNAFAVNEYARNYIENLNRKYIFDDVVHIAKTQIKQLNADYNKNNIVFFDTGLIITKVWFEKVFGNVPDFVCRAIENIHIDMWLLCYPDLEWKADKVRENGGENRLILFNEYKKQLIEYGFNYAIIKGLEFQRLQNSVDVLYSAQGLHKI